MDSQQDYQNVKMKVDGAPSTNSSQEGPQNAQVYNMKHTSKSRCLIFNYEKFKQTTSMKLETRDGTGKDVETLTKTFEKLNFEVIVDNNLTLDGTKEALEQESKRDHTNEDCLVIIFLTHGLDGALYCQDNHKLEVNRLYSYFNASNCKDLAGKPKMFFIQACRGTTIDHGTPMTTGVDDVKMQENNSQSIRIPNFSDYLVFYSTISGYVSFRDPKNGTCFIQSLCQVLDEHSQHKDIVSMLTLTNNKVAYEFEASSTSKPENVHMKQMPCFQSTLTRLAYFGKSTN